MSVYFICGVSGCGKSTIGKAFSDALGFKFYDGDDFHPVENIQKMTSGLPLNDDDRQVWLASINRLVSSEKKQIVIACSALKEKYRILLSQGIKKDIHWIFLDGSMDLILSRMKERAGHFMPAELLQSQFDILEIPAYAEVYDITDPIEEIVSRIIKKRRK